METDIIPSAAFIRKEHAETIEYQIGEDQMEKKVIRSGVFVKVIGIITTAIFSLVSLFLAITGNIMTSICFYHLWRWGFLLLLAYKKERILVGRRTD